MIESNETESVVNLLIFDWTISGGGNVVEFHLEVCQIHFAIYDQGVIIPNQLFQTFNAERMTENDKTECKV